MIYLGNGQLISTSFDKLIIFWDLKTRRVLETVPDCGGTDLEYVGKLDLFLLFENNAFLASLHKPPERSTYQKIERDVGHTKHIWSIMYVSKLDYVLTGSTDNKIISTSLHDFTKILEYDEHTDNVTSFALLSDDGDKFASSSYDRTIKIWNFYSTTSIRTILLHSHWINWIINIKDVVGRDCLISGGSDKTYTVIETETGRLIKRIPTKSWVYRMVPITDLYDSTLFVSSDGFDEVNIWRNKKIVGEIDVMQR
jgi:WD40 repeat protein